MKSILYCLPFLLVMLVLNSCSTFNQNSVGEVKKAAVHSILVSKQIDTSDFPLVGSLINTFAQSDKFNLMSQVAKLQDDVYTSYAKNLPFELIPEDALFANSVYKNTISTATDGLSQWYLAPNGYAKKFFTGKEAKAMAAAFPEANAFISISISFSLKKVGFSAFGLSKAQIVASVNFTIMNDQGKVIIQKSSYAGSKTQIGTVFGGFKADPIQGMCAEATESALVEFNNWLKKNLSKKAS